MSAVDLRFDAATPADLAEVAAALDYRDYEDLGYPACGLPGAVLTWGNVLARQAGLILIRSGSGDLWLGGGDRGSVLLWPYARLAEAKAQGSAGG